MLSSHVRILGPWFTKASDRSHGSLKMAGFSLQPAGILRWWGHLSAAVDRILELRSDTLATTEMELSTLENNRKDVVRQFKVPKISLETTHFYRLTNLNSIKNISQPPVVMDLDDTLIAEMLTKPLVLQQPCHNQAVERHLKLVTEVAFVVTGYEKQNAMIRQKIQSRLLMSKFD